MEKKKEPVGVIDQPPSCASVQHLSLQISYFPNGMLGDLFPLSLSTPSEVTRCWPTRGMAAHIFIFRFQRCFGCGPTL